MIEQVISFFLVFTIIGVLVGTSFFLIRGFFLNDRNYSRADALDMLAKITLFLVTSLIVGAVAHFINIPFHVWHLINGLIAYKFFGEWMSSRFEHKRGVFIVYMFGFYGVSTVVSYMTQISLIENISYVFTNIYPLLSAIFLSINQSLESFMSFLAWIGGLRLAIRGEL